MISAKKAVNEGRYAEGSPEEMLLKQLANTGRSRPAMVGYTVLSTTFNQVIHDLQFNADLKNFLVEKTKTMQATIENYK